jgi:hypothetical protein
MRQKKTLDKWKGPHNASERVIRFHVIFFAPAWQQQVAKCFIFEPKIPMWVTFGGPYDVDIFYGHLVYFTAS